MFYITFNVLLLYKIKHNQDKFKQHNNLRTMQTHKTIKKLFNEYLPNNYKRQICEDLGLEYNSNMEQKIYRVKVGIIKDNDILNALVDLAIKQKRAERKLLKKIK